MLLTKKLLAGALLLLLGAAPAGAQVSFNPATVLPGMEFTGTSAITAQVADINGDGYPDYLYNTVAGGAITYMQNNAGLSFSTPAVNPFAAFAVAGPPGLLLNFTSSIADFDGDGDLDLWGRVSGAANDVYLQNNNGVFVTETVKTGMEFTPTSTGNVHVSDINTDGYPDIIYNTGSAARIVYLQNNGGNSFSTPAPNPFASFATSTPSGTVLNGTSTIADFDGDGDPDLWARLLGAGNDVYLSNNNGSFAQVAISASLEYNSATGSAAISVADFNGDGLVDIVGNYAGGAFNYYQNNGGLSFSTPAVNPFALYATSGPAGIQLNTSSAAADFNGDGDLDLWARQSGAANDLYLDASGAAPALVSSMPANAANNVEDTANISLTFSEPVYAGTGSFFLRKTSDNSLVETMAATGARVTGSGSATITIDPVSLLEPGTGYYLSFNRDALADADGVIAGHLDAVLKKRVPETTPAFLSFTTMAVLPVKLQQFTVTAISGASQLRWETVSVYNSLGFDVQHSSNGTGWVTIGHKATAGNNTALQHYYFVHANPAKGHNYYRLVEKGSDGTIAISDTRTLTYAGAARVNMYPNPSMGDVFLQFDGAAATTVNLFNAEGKKVYHAQKHAATIQLSVAHLPAGIYQVMIQRNAEKWTTTLVRE